MIDLHSHLLPGVDDGPREIDDAVAMCRMAADEGCRILVTTPHLRHPSFPGVTRTRVEEQFARLVDAVGPAVELRLGAEIRIDSELLSEVEAMPGGEVVSLGGSRALLLEMDHSGLGPDPEALVHELRVQGWRPVLAHPEHIDGLSQDIDRAADLVEAGAFLQVTAMSVTGAFGRPAHRSSWDLLEAGLVHVIASDAHSPRWRPPGIMGARRLVEQRLGRAWGSYLTEEFPRCLLDDQTLPPTPTLP